MDDVSGTVRAIVTTAREHDLSFMAGSLAFFVFLSLVPSVMLAVAVGSLVGGDPFAVQVVALFEAYLSEEGRTVLRTTLQNPTGLVGVSVIGLLALVWSVLKAFSAVGIAFGRIYDTDGPVSLLRRFARAIVAVGVVGTGIASLLAVRLVAVSADIVPVSVPGLGRSLVLLAGLVLVLAPLYVVMPPGRVSLGEALPGTLVAAAGLLALQQVFQVYTTLAVRYRTYGLLGAVLLFLLWLYFGALVVLFGAVLNAVFAGRTGATSD